MWLSMLHLSISSSFLCPGFDQEVERKEPVGSILDLDVQELGDGFSKSLEKSCIRACSSIPPN
jgi:hypothetical protein